MVDTLDKRVMCTQQVHWTNGQFVHCGYTGQMGSLYTVVTVDKWVDCTLWLQWTNRQFAHSDSWTNGQYVYCVYIGHMGSMYTVVPGQMGSVYTVVTMDKWVVCTQCLHWTNGQYYTVVPGQMGDSEWNADHHSTHNSS